MARNIVSSLGRFQSSFRLSSGSPSGNSPWTWTNVASTTGDGRIFLKTTRSGALVCDTSDELAYFSPSGVNWSAVELPQPNDGNCLLSTERDFYLIKEDGNIVTTDWNTFYLSPGSTAVTSNDLSTPDRLDLRVSGIDLRARIRVSDWDAVTSDRRTIASRYSGAGTGSWIWAIHGSNFYFMVHRGSDFEYVGTCAQSVIGVVDGEWADLRVTYDETNRMRWYDVNGNLAETDNVTGMTTIHPGSASLRLGNNRNAGGRSAGGLGGDIEWFEMRDQFGNIIQTLSLENMDAANDISWTPEIGGVWSRGSNVSVVGSDVQHNECTLYSGNGRIWDQISSFNMPFFNGTQSTGICLDSGKIVYLANGTSSTSLDGITWNDGTQFYTSYNNLSSEAISAIGDTVLFVLAEQVLGIVGGDVEVVAIDSKIWSSINGGDSWSLIYTSTTPSNSAPGTGAGSPILSVVNNGECFLVLKLTGSGSSISNQNTVLIRVEADGSTISAITIPRWWYSSCWDGRRFILGGGPNDIGGDNIIQNDGIITTSIDGETWSTPFQTDSYIHRYLEVIPGQTGWKVGSI